MTLWLSPVTAGADPVTLVRDLRQVRAFADETAQQDAGNTLLVQVFGNAASAASALTSNLSDLHHMTGSGLAAAQTFGARFAEAPVADSIFSVIFQLTSPHAFALTGTYATTAHTAGESGITTAQALVQFMVTGYNPMTGLGEGLLFNDVFSAHTTAGGTYSNSGVLPAGYHIVLVRGLAMGSEGVGTASALANFNFRFDLTETDMAATPEPATLALLCGGLAGVAAARRRRRNESSAPCLKSTAL